MKKCSRLIAGFGIVLPLLFSGTGVAFAQEEAATHKVVTHDGAGDFANVDNVVSQEMVHPETGQVLTAVLDHDSDVISLFLDGDYVKSVSVEEARQATERQAQENPRFSIQRRVSPTSCGHILNGIAMANSALWLLAGLTVPTGVGTVVTGTAGLVTSGILGATAAYCS